jgi:hypothetical protein
MPNPTKQGQYVIRGAVSWMLMSNSLDEAQLVGAYQPKISGYINKTGEPFAIFHFKYRSFRKFVVTSSNRQRSHVNISRPSVTSHCTSVIQSICRVPDAVSAHSWRQEQRRAGCNGAESKGMCGPFTYM